MTTQDLIAEKRFRDVRVGERLALDVFRAVFTPDAALPVRLSVPDLGIPAGAVLVAVRDDWHSRSFLLRLAHESFAPVPDGDYIPAMPGSPDARWRDVVVSPAVEADEPILCGGCHD